jgi:hypothetical protein
MELKQWLTTLSSELQTSDVTMDEDAVHILLDLARDSAHEIERVRRWARCHAGQRRRHRNRAADERQ